MIINEEKQLALNADLFYDKVTVLLLTESSASFKAACSKNWMENEEQSRIIKIAHVCPLAFKAYLFWIYKGDIAIDTSFRLLFGTDQQDDNTVHKATEALQDLVELWLLADRFADTKLQFG